MYKRGKLECKNSQGVLKSEQVKELVTLGAIQFQLGTVKVVTKCICVKCLQISVGNHCPNEGQVS